MIYWNPMEMTKIFFTVIALKRNAFD